MGSGVFWAIVAGFLVGVFVRSFAPLGTACILFAFLLAFASIALAFLEKEKRIAFVCVAIACVAFACGIMRMGSAVLKGDANLTARVGQHVTVIGAVSAEPDARENETLLDVAARELVVGSTTIAVHAGIQAQLPPHAEVAYGDVVRLSGELQLPQPFDTTDGRTFNYPQYLAASGIAYQMSFASIKRTGKNGGNFLKAIAIGAKETYLRGEDAVLPEPEAGLAGGITVGDKRSIGPELTQDFTRDSLIHMVVLSGYNITVVVNAVARLLQWAPRTAQFGGASFVVLFFILMSGGASSATRAGLMALLAAYARQTGRTFEALRALCFVSFAMVAWNPFTLAYDPSFQLSALATLGLISFTPLFARVLGKVPERFGLREIASSTIATQLIVLPFLLYQSGQLSLYALPANLLALAPVPLSMLCSFVAALAGIVFGTYASWIAYPAYLLLAYIIEVAKFFSSLPLAGEVAPAFPAGWLLLAYGILFAVRLARPMSQAEK